VVPQDWKEATIIPILKPNKHLSDPLSYRPISLTSCLSKIMERFINNRINWYLETKNLLQRTQAGFRPGRSTLDHIISQENDVATEFSKKLSTYAIFLDIAKAFDRTSTDGVLFKLSKLGIIGNTLKWIKSFLSGRSAKVRVGNQLSDARTLSQGVPQGAVLSPTLFNVMMSDMPPPPSKVTTLTYADDVAVYTAQKNKDQAEQTLQLFLDKLYKWGKNGAWNSRQTNPTS
jgi:Reverse transcriptase (RNA-dependent DNA polymerase)